MAFAFPAPVERPNPYTTFVATFLQARDQARKYKEAEDRLQLAKEAEARQKQAEKDANERYKLEHDLRQASFEHDVKESERKFAASQAEFKWRRLNDFDKMRNPNPGQPFSLQLPSGLTPQEGTTEVQPMFFDDIEAAKEAEARRRLQDSMALKASPGAPDQPPAPVVVPRGFDVPGIAAGPTDPRLLSAAVARANTGDRIDAAAAAREASPASRVAMRDSMGNVTGFYNKVTRQHEPLPNGAGGFRTAAVPAKEFDKLDEGKKALMTMDALERQLDDFINTPMTDPVAKAEKGMLLNRSVQAMSRTVGRSLGEKGVFTDADKADFAKFMNPGMVLSTLNPKFAKTTLTEARNIMRRAIGNTAKTFKQRYGSIPEDSVDFLDYAPGATPKNDPGGLFK